MSTGCEPQREGQVWDMAGQADQAMLNLEEQIESLMSRLGPVLRDDPETEPDSAPEPAMVLMATRFGLCRDRAELMSRKVRSMIERLEI